jgi:hypothetical protein
MYHIATATRTTNGSFDFTNIPQTFTHLRIHAKLRTATGGAGANTALYFNGDGGTNYRIHYSGADGSTQFSGDFGAGQGFSCLGWVGNTAATAGLFSTHIFDIVDYTGSTFKTLRGINGFDSNNSTTNLVGYWSAVWKQTAAITRINTSDTFAIGSTMSIYGIPTPTATGA